MEFKLFNSISEISEDGLEVFDDCIYSKGFYEFVEAENNDKLIPYYFLGYEKGNVSAFAPCFIQKKAVTFDPCSYLSGKLRNMLKALGLKTEQFFVVYTPYRLRSDIKTIGGASKGFLFKKILDFASKLKCDGIVFPFVGETNKELDSLLLKNGFVKAFYDANFYLNTDFPSYESFLKSLKKWKRKELKRDARILTQRNIQIKEVGDIKKYSKSFEDLHRMLLAKYKNENLEFTQVSFENLYKYVKNAASFIAVDRDEVLGFSLGIYDKSTFHSLRCGQNYEKTGSTNIYFTLVYSESVKKAIQLGCKKADYGVSMHKAKLLRGCKYEKNFIYFKFFNPVVHNIMKIKTDRLSKHYYNSFLKEIDFK